MQRALFTEEEVRLASERRLKYQGTAKVSLDQIMFEPPLPRDLDPKNLKRIKGVFRKNHCRRFDIDNHVPAVVSRHDLAVALQQAEVPALALMTNTAERLPTLRFSPGQLLGLHGRHRAQVGSEVLAPVDRWWTVDLYLDDIGNDLKTSLIEEYANERRPTDGEIYRKIRQYEGEQNEPFRQRWFVRLSRSKQERLEQLDKGKNRRLRGGFDSLLRIPGIWPRGMRVSMLHRLIATNCVEEVMTYLDHIGDFWSSLVDADSLAMMRIDQDTVDTLQSMAPGQSRADARSARGYILSGQVFAGFSEMERRNIWNRMKGFNGLIPSLYTFFEDFKYLESCSQSVKRLLGAPNESVWNTMKHMFVVPEEIGEDCLIQTSESTVRRQRADDAERLDLGYRQIWLYAMRHYPLMPPDPKRNDDLLAKPNRAKADERAIYEMADLARRLGFCSSEIEQILKESPDRRIARAALLQARKPDRFRYDPGLFERFLRQFEECASAATPCQPENNQELLADSSVKARARCGMPRIGTHKQDSRLLFLDNLHVDEVPVAETITTFFVRRCVYFAFFGKPSLSQARDPPLGGNPPPRDLSPTSSLFLTDHIAAIGPGTTSSQSPTTGQPDSEQREIYRRQGQHEIQQTRHGRGRQRRKDGSRQRRAQKNQERIRQAERAEMAQQSMELDSQSIGSTDQDMSDVGCSTPLPTDAYFSDPQPVAATGALIPANPEHNELTPHALFVDQESYSEREAHWCGTISESQAPWEVMTEYSEDHMPEPSTDEVVTHNPSETTPGNQKARATPPDSEKNNGESFERQSHENQRVSRVEEIDQQLPAAGAAVGAQSENDHEEHNLDEDLQAYIDRLQTARQEQDRLEEQRERERLQHELNLSPQSSPQPQPSADNPRSDNPQTPTSSVEAGTLRPDVDQQGHEQEGQERQADLTANQKKEAADISGPVQENRLDSNISSHQARPVTQFDMPSSVADAGGAGPRDNPAPATISQGPTPSGHVDISFWVFEREEWRQTNRLNVDPSDPSPVERVARKYIWKGYSLYDQNLQSLGAAQCFQAATVDGNNAIFVISEADEKMLATQGRLVKDRTLLSSVSRVLAPTEPDPLAKRRRGSGSTL